MRRWRSAAACTSISRPAIAVWFVAAALVTATQWSLAGRHPVQRRVLALCLPLVQRFRTAKMPLIARRWYDIPLRATLVATLVAPW